MSEFHVDPPQMLVSSAGFADLQAWASQIHRGLIGSLDDAAGMAGDDKAGHAFAAKYDPAARKVANALGKAVAHLGGTANSLYTMALNYIKADADVSASMMKPQQLPQSSGPRCDSEPRELTVPTAVGKANWAVREIIARFWPQGDPDKLRQAGRDWQRAAELINRLGLEGDKQVRPVITGSRGKAVDTFADNWRRMHVDCTTTGPLLNTLSTTAQQLSESCNAYAQHIEELRSDLEHMAEVAAGVAVVGIALTFFTLGASDAVAAGGEAAIATEAAIAATTMAASVETSAELAVLAEAAAVVDSAAARIIIPAATTTATTLAAAQVANAATTTPAAPGQPLPPDPASAFPLLPPLQQHQVQQWMGQMHADGRTSPAPAPTSTKPKINARRAYQLRVAGSTEYNLYTPLPNGKGGQRGMNADGVRPQDGAAVDAKYVGQQDSCRSPLRLNNVDNVPSYVYASTEKGQADEVVRYGEAFKDPRNKVNHLEVITNDEKAGAYYDAMLAAKGVPGETRIVK
ncbi:restriction endonuclease fold toxin-2 domain-containing protein [Streptomyces rimosus]|uniref:restriction endonuclease fold toxin-2 domain-containing protein n=1 Tax=Streptomyces rimosus TaxID=1927 RepID=UPI000A4502B1|nr:restriction endonuclease fold toxin-2 domain-containing protein [Streptomyces rimosus]